MNNKTALSLLLISFVSLALLVRATPVPQQQVSGGGSVAVVQGGNTWAIGSSGAGKVNNSEINGVAIATGNGVGGTGVQRVAIASDNSAVPISGSISNTAFALNGGVANVGIVRVVPSSCTQSTNFANSTVGVATGAGTTVTSTTTCVTFAYANNITNAAVTLRLADRQGTPVIWFGGNADFSIPANSNIRIPLDGVTFTSGITAIAGTAAAINLQVNGLQ